MTPKQEPNRCGKRNRHNSKFHFTLVEHMEKNKLKATDVADIVGVHFSTVHKWMRGPIVPMEPLLKKLNTLFDTDLLHPPRAKYTTAAPAQMVIDFDIPVDRGITVDKGVPMPPVKREYPFSKMVVGDSFFVPVSFAKVRGREMKCKDIDEAAVQWAKERGYSVVKFHTIPVEGGVRCWRVE